MMQHYIGNQGDCNISTGQLANFDSHSPGRITVLRNRYVNWQALTSGRDSLSATSTGRTVSRYRPVAEDEADVSSLYSAKLYGAVGNWDV